MKIYIKDQAGDTIIEVIISMVILSTAFVMAYSLSTAALRNSASADHRSEALAIAQGEVEILKDMIAKGTDVSSLKTATPYCIDFQTFAKSASCAGFNGSIYDVAMSYTSPTYTVGVKWPDPKAANGTADLTIYYRQ